MHGSSCCLVAGLISNLFQFLLGVQLLGAKVVLTQVRITAANSSKHFPVDVNHLLLTACFSSHPLSSFLRKYRTRFKYIQIVLLVHRLQVNGEYSAITESTVGLVHLLFETGGWIGALLLLGVTCGFGKPEKRCHSFANFD